jgi:nucleoside diphosphate kinase
MAVIKPDAYMNMGKVIDAMYQAGFKLNRLKMSRFNADNCGQFYKEHAGRDFYPNLARHRCSDVSIGVELVAQNAVEKWRQVCGPTNSVAAK